MAREYIFVVFFMSFVRENDIAKWQLDVLGGSTGGD